MVEKSATILNTNGIHCRPSAEIVKAVQSYRGNVKVVGASGECDPRSIMALLAMGLQCGNQVTVSVAGEDEEQVCERLVGLFETHFDFPPRQDGEEPDIDVKQAQAG